MAIIHEPRELIAVHTPLGFGHAMFIEFGEYDTCWTVVLETQAVVTFPQEKIRISRSYTHGRGISDDQMKQIIKPKASTRTPRSMGRMLRKTV
ncbi:hypothetical protein [Bradyrhizobium oligotrophicum]|uniref:hypothetical protein n=1 Tax=Bradyrhizobium oligotrophicum TaxID=44255 RepID=UPI003EBF853C